jgi:hypothetical protein
MGTSNKLPRAYADILLMERFSCTEKQLYEEFTQLTIQRVSWFDELRSNAQRVKEMDAKFNAPR